VGSPAAAGKSRFPGWLLRLFDVQSGGHSGFDGVDIQPSGPHRLSQKIAVFVEEPVIFAQHRRQNAMARGGR